MRDRAAEKTPVGSLDLSVASVSLHLESQEDELCRQLANRYQNFLISHRGAFDLFLDFSDRRAATQSSPQALTVGRAGHKWVFTLHQAEAECELHRQRATIHGAFSLFTIDSFLRVLLSLLLLERDGLMLHAATIAVGDHADTFMGRSGAGKTTLSRLAPAECVLTDEISLVRLVQEKPRAYGSPFWGEFGGPGHPRELPLEAIYVLAKDRRNFREQLPRAEAVAVLCAHTLFFVSDREMTQALLQLCSAWVEAVPVYRLHFVPDSTVWEALRPEAPVSNGRTQLTPRKSRC